MATEPEIDLVPDPGAHPQPWPWRERLERWAETFDLSLGRLVAGAILVAVLGVVGWRLLAPSPAPPEMSLPVATGPGGASGSMAEAASAVGRPDGSPAVEPSSDAASGAGPAGAPEAPPAEVVVHVAGAVHSPGVHRLRPPARWVDAVDAAGGATGDADLAGVNLAAPVEDGQQVYVPAVGEQPRPPAPGPAGAPGAPAGPGGEAGGGLIDVNTAGAEDLQSLPGVGPAISQAIVDHRDQHGPFTSVDQLIDVRGIGEAKLEAIRDLVTV